MNRRLAAAALLTVAAAGPLAAQSLKAGLVGEPSVGKPTPNIVLPYFTGADAGPADQPFRLGAELGRVVVLFFGGTPSEATRAGWSAVAARVDSLTSPRIQLVGVAVGNRSMVAAWSAGLGARLKVLADSAGLVHRQFGVRGRDGWRVFVVADDGRLVAVDRRPEFGSTAWWQGLGRTIRQGVTAGGR